MAVLDEKKNILLDDLLRARLEGAFVSPCGTEGALWDGFPEWPEQFPYDVFVNGEAEPEKHSFAAWPDRNRMVNADSPARPEDET